MLIEKKHVAFAASALFAIVGCSAAGKKSGTADTGQSSSEATILADSAKNIALHLTKFDTLDFDVFSNQKWDRLKESHAADITVSWPDGHETKGIERHIEDLKALFVFAPDLEIKVHPIRFGSGTWTAVSGVMSVTF